MLPMTGLRELHVDCHARHRVDDRERIGTRFDTSARVLANVGLIRRELRDQRLLRHRATGSDDSRRHLRIVAELHTAFLDVRARDVDLDRIDRRILEAARHFDVILDGRTADVGNETRLAEIQRRQNLRHDMIDAGILQADRIQHAHRCFVDAMRWIAEPRLSRRALEHDAPGVAIRESFDARVFLAKADASRQQHDR